MRRRGGERGRKQEASAKQQAARRCDFEDIRFLNHRAMRVEPTDMALGLEVALRRQPVIPVAPAGPDQQRPHVLGRHAEIDRVRPAAHDASRATVCTTLTPSSFYMSRASCASETIW